MRERLLLLASADAVCSLIIPAMQCLAVSRWGQCHRSWVAAQYESWVHANPWVSSADVYVLATASWVGQLYNAVVPNRVRGLAIGVQYFDLYQTPTPDPIFGSTSYPSYDEIHYVNSIAPMLRYNGFPPYFLVDQSRAGRQNIRNSLNDWCNVKVRSTLSPRHSGGLIAC